MHARGPTTWPLQQCAATLCFPFPHASFKARRPSTLAAAIRAPLAAQGPQHAMLCLASCICSVQDRPATLPFSRLPPLFTSLQAPPPPPAPTGRRLLPTPDQASALESLHLWLAPGPAAAGGMGGSASTQGQLSASMLEGLPLLTSLRVGGGDGGMEGGTSHPTLIAGPLPQLSLPAPSTHPHPPCTTPTPTTLAAGPLPQLPLPGLTHGAASARAPTPAEEPQHLGATHCPPPRPAARARRGGRRRGAGARRVARRTARAAGQPAARAADGSARVSVGLGVRWAQAGWLGGSAQGGHVPW